MSSCPAAIRPPRPVRSSSPSTALARAAWTAWACSSTRQTRRVRCAPVSLLPNEPRYVFIWRAVKGTGARIKLRRLRRPGVVLSLIVGWAWQQGVSELHCSGQGVRRRSVRAKHWSEQSIYQGWARACGAAALLWPDVLSQACAAARLLPPGACRRICGVFVACASWSRSEASHRGPSHRPQRVRAHAQA